jgi:hypothetical protein
MEKNAAIAPETGSQQYSSAVATPRIFVISWFIQQLIVSALYVLFLAIVKLVKTKIVVF